MFGVPVLAAQSATKNLYYKMSRGSIRKNVLGLTLNTTNNNCLRRKLSFALDKKGSNRINVERREKYGREKFESECFTIDDKENGDLSTLLQSNNNNNNNNIYLGHIDVYI